MVTTKNPGATNDLHEPVAIGGVALLRVGPALAGDHQLPDHGLPGERQLQDLGRFFSLGGIVVIAVFILISTIAPPPKALTIYSETVMTLKDSTVKTAKVWLIEPHAQVTYNLPSGHKLTVKTEFSKIKKGTPDGQ